MPFLSWISGGSKKPTTTTRKEEAQVPLLANYLISKPDGLQKPKLEADHVPATSSTQHNNLPDSLEKPKSKAENIIHATLSSDQKLISIADHLILKANGFGFQYNKHEVIGLHEQAAKLYKVAKKYEKSKEAFIKASMGKKIIFNSTPCGPEPSKRVLEKDIISQHPYWSYKPRVLESAAKDTESAANLAKKLGNETDAIDLYTSASRLYTRTSNMYLESAKISEYAAAQEKGMRALKDVAPAVAISLYTDYFDILEDDDDFSISPSIYQEATKIYIKLEKYMDAAALLFRFGSSSRSCDAYLSAIIVYLYAQDLEQAEKCYNDCCRHKYFLRSEHFSCAGELLNAYKEADADKIIQEVALKDSCIRSLWPRILKLADKLPTNEAKLRASLDFIKV